MSEDDEVDETVDETESSILRIYGKIRAGMTDDQAESEVAGLRSQLLIPQSYGKADIEALIGRKLTDSEWQDILTDEDIITEVDSVVLELLAEKFPS